MHKDHKVLIEFVVVIILVVFGLWTLNKNSSTTPASTMTDNNSQQIGSTEDTTAGSVNNGLGVSLSYAQALSKYKDARLQLDKDCQGSPDKMTFSNKSYLMVDNRAPVNRIVKVGSTFTIKAYGFKIVKLESATLPATWYVDCGVSQNVSTITIQK